jgi:hypothetical protein
MHKMFDSRHVTGAQSAIPGETPLEEITEVDDDDTDDEEDDGIKAKRRKRKSKGDDELTLLDEKNPFVRMYKKTTDAIRTTATYLNKQPRRIAVQTGYEWVMEKLSRQKSCYKMFRMYPDVFMSLHDLLVSTYGLESTREMSSIECLGMFLWMLGGPQSFTQAEDRFVRSTETIHRKFKHVLQCVYALGGDIIKPTDPTFAQVHPKIRDKRFWPHFKGCIGAIDGSHVPVVVPAKETVNYTG